MFAADSMRACRLVVDTGLHALGWSREQAVDYMVANSPLAEESMCRPEIDRYIVSPGPGDVLHGRVGWRSSGCAPRPSSARGAPSRCKKFHSAVLDSGSLPLGVLDDVVRSQA